MDDRNGELLHPVLLLRANDLRFGARRESSALVSHATISATATMTVRSSSGRAAGCRALTIGQKSYADSQRVSGSKIFRSPPQSKAFHSMVCNRLEVICHEDRDILAASPWIVPFVATSLAQSKERYSSKIGEARLMIGNCIRMMCRSPKSCARPRQRRRLGADQQSCRCWLRTRGRAQNLRQHGGGAARRCGLRSREPPRHAVRLRTGLSHASMTFEQRPSRNASTHRWPDMSITKIDTVASVACSFQSGLLMQSLDTAGAKEAREQAPILLVRL
jgi:hypothetical protein